MAGGRKSPSSADAAIPGKPDWREFLTPRRLFIVLGLLAAIAVLAFRGPALVLERDRLIRERELQVQALADAAAALSARIYDGSSRLATDISDHARNTDLNPASLSAFLRSRVGDTVLEDYAVVLDIDGRIVATSRNEPAPPVSYNSATLRDRIAQADHRIDPVIKSRLTGEIIYPLSQRLVDGQGRLIGVVSVNVIAENVRPSAQRRPADPVLTVWRTDGRFIGSNFLDFDANGRARIPTKPSGLGLAGSGARKAEGVITAAAEVIGWPLVVVASYDTAGVLTEWRRDAWETAGLIVLVLIGVGALVWIGILTADREARALQVAEGALKERDMLLKEIHHRVKNSLLMTSSLIHLQARQFTDPTVLEAFESTRRRLTSIGLVHDALYSGADIEQVDLALYLPKLLEDVAQAHGAKERNIAMEVEVEPVLLTSERATAIGLIVSEATTNAFKHAFEPAGPGKITVRGGLTPAGLIEIIVRDDGKGLHKHADKANQGLGTRLIKSLTEQLRGTMAMANEDGAVFRFTFPAAPDRS